jgi:hypothetical protein
MFRRFPGMMFGLFVMTMRDMRVMAGLFVIPRLVMPGRLLVVGGGALMMFRCLLVMFSALMLSHKNCSSNI